MLAPERPQPVPLTVVGVFRRQRRFDAELRRLIAQLVEPTTPVTYPDGDTVQVGGLTIGLANLRARWGQLEPPERLPWLQATLPALVSPPPIPSRLQSTRSLRPGIRHRAMLEAARLAKLGNEVNADQPRLRALIPHQPFGADLVSVLLWDAETTMSVIDQSQLDEWGADFDDLFPVAVDNLAEKPGTGWTSIHKQLYASNDTDDYTGTRMLLPGHLESTGLGGELVVLHPNRSRLLVAAVDDAKGIARACATVFDEIGAPSPVSLQPLVGRPGHWRPLVVPPTHPAHEMWHRLVQIDRQLIHDRLRQPLQSLLGSDVLVADHRVVEDGSGTYRSVTTWTEGTPSLLPRTDLIDLVTEWGSVTVPWDEVQQLVGPLMEPTEHYPELWRVVGFPGPRELTELSHRART